MRARKDKRSTVARFISAFAKWRSPSYTSHSKVSSRPTTLVTRALARISTPTVADPTISKDECVRNVVSPNSRNSESAATHELSMRERKIAGAATGRSETPMVTQVSPGRTVMTEKPTVPRISSAGLILSRLVLVIDKMLDVGLLNLDFVALNIAKFVNFNGYLAHTNLGDNFCRGSAA